MAYSPALTARLGQALLKKQLKSTDRLGLRAPPSPLIDIRPSRTQLPTQLRLHPAQATTLPGFALTFRSQSCRVSLPPTSTAQLCPRATDWSLPIPSLLYSFSFVEADAFALARSGSIPLSQALALAQNYKEETDYTVWLNLTNNLVEVRALLIGLVWISALPHCLS